MAIKKEHYWIRPRKKLLEYQVRLFEKEREKMQKKYDELVAGQQMRAEVYGARFKTKEELEEAYIAGLVTDQEYRKQTSAIWQAYSDRGYIDRIMWLTEERDAYQRQLDLLNEYLEELKGDMKRRSNQTKRKHNKRGYYRQTLEKMEAEKREREEERLERIRAEQLKVREQKKRARKKQLKERQEKYKEILPDEYQQ